jgi:hypothetical protein
MFKFKWPGTLVVPSVNRHAWNLNVYWNIGKNDYTGAHIRNRGMIKAVLQILIRPDQKILSDLDPDPDPKWPGSRIRICNLLESRIWIRN